MFLILAARKTYVKETNFAARKQKNIFALSRQKYFCFPDTNFAFETYVSQFSHCENNLELKLTKNCFPATASVQKWLTGKGKEERNWKGHWKDEER